MFMKLNKSTLRIFAGVLIIMSMALGGCATSVGTQAHYHRPAHVWYDYYYYPTLDIYLEINSGYYWHQSHDKWIRVRQLPPQFKLHGHKPVYLHLDVDQPYRHHKEHRERYLPHPSGRADIRKDIPQHSVAHQVDARQQEQHRRVDVRKDSTRRDIEYRGERSDSKGPGIHQALERRGTLREDIPHYNVNRPVDAHLKQARDKDRSANRNLHDNGDHQSGTGAVRKASAKPVREEQKAARPLPYRDQRRIEHKGTVEIIDADN
jgi:hypothetical protein